jgi:hypothetical protein
MRIGEPMTVATDALVAACATAWGLRLLRAARQSGQRTIAWWAAAFAAIAVAAAAGGAWHAVQEALTDDAADALWRVTLIAAGVVGFTVLGATISAHVRGRARTVLLVLTAAKLVAYVAWTATHRDFLWVILDYGSSLLVALVVHLVAWWRWRSAAAPWIVAAVVVSFAAAGVQRAVSRSTATSTTTTSTT